MKKENKKKSSTAKDKNFFDIQSVNLSNEQKVWLGIASITLMVLLVVLTIFFLNNVIFEDNKHFTISAVKIDTQGKTASYWNDPRTVDTRSAELAREMGIERNKDNLFALNLEEKRKDLLKGHPEMEDVQLIPILPDILQIRITERLPVARLDDPDKTDAKVIDKNRYVFAARYYSDAKSFPFIKDQTSSEELIMGKQVEGDGIQFLLDFIHLLGSNEFQFQVISAELINDNDTISNYGKCIKAHLKRGAFACKSIYIPFPQDGAIESLKVNCQRLKKHAEEYPRVESGELNVTAENVSLR